MSKTPNTLTYSGKRLEEMKVGNEVPKKVLDELRERAEKHLDAPVIAVVYRKAVPVTKNPHEYASYGTYWWPNPDTPDGLPYVRRDGLQSPITTADVWFEEMADMVRELTLAAYYFEEEKYAKKAVKMIYDWYLNPETYMIPHAEYSQAIPGICNGRGIGVIDFHTSFYIWDSVAILDSLGYISEEFMRGMKKWYSDFADWLLTSENGLDEAIQENNHGTWYDVAVLGAALFSGRKMLADKICKTAYDIRFKSQVRKDGSQPLELARTMGLVYSAYNAMAMALVANMAEINGFKKYWEEDEEYGAPIIKKAVDYIYPYVLNPETFPYQELSFEFAEYRLAKIMMLLDARFPGERYAERAEVFIKRMKKHKTWLAQPMA